MNIGTGRRVVNNYYLIKLVIISQKTLLSYFCLSEQQDSELVTVKFFSHRTDVLCRNHCHTCPNPMPGTTVSGTVMPQKPVFFVVEMRGGATRAAFLCQPSARKAAPPPPQIRRIAATCCAKNKGFRGWGRGGGALLQKGPSPTKHFKLSLPRAHTQNISNSHCHEPLPHNIFQVLSALGLARRDLSLGPAPSVFPVPHRGSLRPPAAHA